MTIGAVVLLAVFAAVLLANPRHRAFYFGESPADGKAPAAPDRAARLPVSGRPTVERAPDSTRPPETRLPVPDSQGRVLVPIADQMPWRLPAEGPPSGWSLREFTGNSAVELTRADGRLALRLRADHASFAVYREVVLDLAQYPYLTWSWKVTRLPAHGDVRDASRNDQAAQVYVVFPRWPNVATASEAIGYVWDSQAPVGTQTAFAKAPNVRVLVLQSGAANTETWRREQRNVAQDYQALFGRQAPRVGAIALMSDADDTRTDAESYFGDLAFSRAPIGSVENPTSMLR